MTEPDVEWTALEARLFGLRDQVRGERRHVEVDDAERKRAEVAAVVEPLRAPLAAAITQLQKYSERAPTVMAAIETWTLRLPIATAAGRPAVVCADSWAMIQQSWSQAPAALQQAESLARDLDVIAWRPDFATMARELRRRLEVARDWVATFERGWDEVFGARGLQQHCERAWDEFIRPRWAARPTRRSWGGRQRMRREATRMGSSDPNWIDTSGPPPQRFTPASYDQSGKITGGRPEPAAQPPARIPTSESPIDRIFREGFKGTPSYNGELVADMTPTRARQVMKELLEDDWLGDPTHDEYPRAQRVYHALSIRAAGGQPSGGAPTTQQAGQLPAPSTESAPFDWFAKDIPVEAIAPPEVELTEDDGRIIRAIGHRANLVPEDFKTLSSVIHAVQQDRQPRSLDGVMAELHRLGTPHALAEARLALLEVKKRAPEVWPQLERLLNTPVDAGEESSLIGDDPRTILAIAGIARKRGLIGARR